APELMAGGLGFPLEVIELHVEVDGGGFPTGADPLAEVRILEVANRESIVEPAQVVNEIASCHHAGGRDGRTALQAVGRAGPPSLLAVDGEYPVSQPRQGLIIHTLVLDGTVLEQQQRTDDAYIAVVLQPLDQALHPVRRA